METPQTPEPADGFQPTRQINVHKTEESIEFSRIWRTEDGREEERKLEGEEEAKAVQDYVSQQLSSALDPRLLPLIDGYTNPISFAGRHGKYRVHFAILVTRQIEEATPAPDEERSNIIPVTLDSLRHMLPGGTAG